MADRKTILLTFDLDKEPNEDKLVAVKFDGCEMEFRSFHGFEVKDIYELLFGKEISDEA